MVVSDSRKKIRRINMYMYIYEVMDKTDRYIYIS